VYNTQAANSGSDCPADLCDEILDVTPVLDVTPQDQMISNFMAPSDDGVETLARLTHL
jgi:hypothetical protein